MTTLPAANGSLRLLHAAAYLSLFCVGLYVTSFGPAMPFLARDLGVSLGTAGLLLTLLFIGSITASGAVAVQLHNIDSRTLAMAGLGLIVAGLVALSLAPGWETALPSGLALGAGDGLIVASSHSIMAATSENAPGGITRLNLFFAIGAIAGPLWSGAVFEASGGREVVFGGVAAAAAGVFALMAVARNAPALHETQSQSARAPLGSLVWVMGAVLFLYVGAEMGLGAWVSSYAREAAGAGIMTGAVVTAAYWAALALGRLLTGALLSRGHDASVVLIGSVAGAGVASLALALFGSSLMAGAAAAFATGLFFGPVWPVAVSIGSSGAHSGAPAALVTIGNAGGILFPWLQGLVLASAGPGEGISMTAALCAAMLALAMVSRARQPAAL